MSFWSAVASKVGTGISARAKDERQRADDRAASAIKHAEVLLSSDDPEIQMTGMSILEQASQPSQRKKGFAGFLGEFEQPEHLRPLLDHANRLRAMSQGDGTADPSAPMPGNRRAVAGPATGPGLGAPPAIPGAASMSTSAPVDPSSQGPAPPGGSMLSRASGMSRGGITPPLGEAAPEDTSLGGQLGGGVGGASFGGIPLPAQQPPGQPALSLGSIAAKVSRDKGVPQPGERKHMFWPSKAQLRREERNAEFEVDANWLQRVGATPAESKRAVLARMGASSGAGNLTNAGYVRIPTPDGKMRLVQTFTMENPSEGTYQLVYAGDNGAMVPLPPGYESQRMTGMGGVPSQTTTMSGAQLMELAGVDPRVEEELAGLGPINPRGFYKKTEKGDLVVVSPTTAPSVPWQIRSTGTGQYPGIMTPGQDPELRVPNPRVTAAKAMLKQFNALPAMMRMTPQLQMRRIQELLGQYPVLARMRQDQILALAGADDYLPEDAEIQLLQGTQSPALPEVPGGANVPPPMSDPNKLPDDWADKLAAALAAQAGRGSSTSTVQGSGRPPQ